MDALDIILYFMFFGNIFIYQKWRIISKNIFNIMKLTDDNDIETVYSNDEYMCTMDEIIKLYLDAFFHIISYIIALLIGHILILVHPGIHIVNIAGIILSIFSLRNLYKIYEMKSTLRPYLEKYYEI